mmetsp:Transcript_96360/g.305690  ORF Transcript_96360/g.305690 Transcript_96360/m.305690 type:complete len:281 (+) Transcript_96360:61-903(+)
MVGTVLRDVAGELGDLHVTRELLLECPKEDLPLARLKTIHHAGDCALDVVLGKENQLLLDEVIVTQRRLAMIHEGALLTRANPLLAVVGTLWMECHVNEVLVLSTTVSELDLVVLNVSKVLPRFLGGAGPKTLVVLALPSATFAVLILPRCVLRQREKRVRLVPLRDLDNGCDKLLQEARHLQQGREPLLDEVDDQTLDVGTVVVLVGHDHDRAIAEALAIDVLLGGIQGHNLHDLVYLLVLEHLLDCELSHVAQLPTKREHTVVVTANDSEPRHRQCFG